MGILGELFTDYTLRTVAAGAVILGIISGALGGFAVLRKQSLLGDAISHAALPGIALAFMLTGRKSPLILILGAAFAGWIGMLFLMSILNNTRIKSDGALGLILSTFFGFGLVLLTFIQRSPDANKAGLDHFLFGQASTLLERDVLTMGILAALALIVLSLFWKEFKLLSFDPDFSASIGYPVKILDVLLTTLLVTAIVIGLQTVGVVLMSAMVVAPAAAARQWTDRLGAMILLSALFGAVAGVSGAVLSSITARMPTGPIIVICITFLVLVSILFAPNRGLVMRWLRHQRNRRKLQLEAVLFDLYELARQHDQFDCSHPTEVLEAMSVGKGESVRNSLRELAGRRWVNRNDRGQWALTAEGYREAGRLVEKRLK
jgi:manganese/zinc/iron transport system permease protein